MVDFLCAGVNKWISNTLDFCRKTGYVETIAGRRRYLESIRTGSKIDKAQAERQAVNTTIQGTAADIFKNSFVRVDEKLNSIFASNGNNNNYGSY